MGEVLSAAMLAVSRGAPGGAFVVILLTALSMRYKRRPALPRDATAVLVSVVCALGVAVALNGALVFAPLVLAIWTALAGMVLLAWLGTRPAVRRVFIAWLRPRDAESRTGRVLTTGR